MTPSGPRSLPHRVSSPSGLVLEFLPNGCVRRIEQVDIVINLFPGNVMEGGPCNLFLRRHGAQAAAIPLLGPASPAAYQADGSGFSALGEWDGLRFHVKIVLAQDAPVWFWHVEVQNTGTMPVTCDLSLTQDLALAHYGAVRLNEYYVSHYVDHTPLEHPDHGHVIASRQNQSMGGRCPWLLIGSLGRAVSFATDALQFHGRASRAGHPAEALVSGLPGRRLQHEHSLVALQEEPFSLEPGASLNKGFFSWFEADHPAASGEADLAIAGRALALPEARPPAWLDETSTVRPACSLFASAPLLACRGLSDDELREIFGADWRHAERDNGELWSFFTAQGGHVATRTKELAVLRPHGHLLRSGAAWLPDEAALTSTTWMSGVFHSMVTQGHVSINRFLSTCHGYLGQFRSHGLRVFAEIAGEWRLLDLPSAYEMTPDSCRWIYQHHGGRIEVRAWAAGDRHELGLSIEVTAGPPLHFLISLHVALNGDDGSAAIPAVWEHAGDSVVVRAMPDSDVGRRFPHGSFEITPDTETPLEAVGGDELLFADGASRSQPYVCLRSGATRRIALAIHGRLLDTAPLPAEDFSAAIAPTMEIAAPASPPAAAAVRVAEIFPWFVHNALVHYLSPRGLEQYSGGGWGTRDVCQGPVELLLACGRFERVREVLRLVFRQQNPDGDWPQWFMFFDRERNIRPGESHGDIVYWPVLALSQYLTTTGDSAFLDESLPFFHPDGETAAEHALLRVHLDRALDVMLDRVVPGTNLAAYGHGDWNDSLQPARPELRDRLCSSWTVTLNYQTFITLAEALQRIGNPEKAAQLKTMAANILDEFQRALVVDGIITGCAYFHENGKTDYLFHPRDGVTCMAYSLLPMIHAIINDMLSQRQAAAHLALIRDHLSGPDGAHLFDRPPAYHGGPQTHFQRAESASYFGREIGIMYTHAHLRYGEALARFGDAAGFFQTLCQANPIAIREIVPSAAPRQANCYYSSSDAAFADRYEAGAQYERVKRGEITLEGGWRVYSSGAGIGARLIVQHFIGLRLEKHALLVDPVIPAALDGMRVSLVIHGRPLEVVYRITRKGCGVTSVNLNGMDLDFIRLENPYRTGAARVSMQSFLNRVSGVNDRLTVCLE